MANEREKRVDWHLERQLIVQRKGRKETDLPFLSAPYLSWFDEPSLSFSFFSLSLSFSFSLSLFCEPHAVIKVLHVSSSVLAGGGQNLTDWESEVRDGFLGDHRVDGLIDGTYFCVIKVQIEVVPIQSVREKRKKALLSLSLSLSLALLAHRSFRAKFTLPLVVIRIVAKDSSHLPGYKSQEMRARGREGKREREDA